MRFAVPRLSSGQIVYLPCAVVVAVAVQPHHDRARGPVPREARGGAWSSWQNLQADG